jgi:hypothetical protein
MQTHVAVVPDGRSCYSLRPMPSPSPPPGVRRESSAAHPPTCDPGSTAVRYRGSFTPREFSVRACAAAKCPAAPAVRSHPSHDARPLPPLHRSKQTAACMLRCSTCCASGRLVIRRWCCRGTTGRGRGPRFHPAVSARHGIARASGDLVWSGSGSVRVAWLARAMHVTNMPACIVVQRIGSVCGSAVCTTDKNYI